MTDVSIVRYFILTYEVGRLREEAHAVSGAASSAGGRVPQAGRVRHGRCLGDPPERAVIVFHGDRSVAEEFAARDPYVQSGLVQCWEVQPWAVIPGEVFDNLR